MWVPDFKKIPQKPGVYFFKFSNGKIAYIGKARSLRSRVRSYFKKAGNVDWKVAQLLKESAVVEYIETDSSIEAGLLEAQLIQEHQPQFNVLLKSGQPFIYILFTPEHGSKLAAIKIVRTQGRGGKGVYVGPFLERTHARSAYQFLIKNFRLYTCNKKIPSGCLEYHLGICAGTCLENFDSIEYNLRMRVARDMLKGDWQHARAELEELIKNYTAQKEYEKGRNIYEYLKNLDKIADVIRTQYRPEKFSMDIARVTASSDNRLIETAYSLKTALELKDLLKLETVPRVIDCFDISHFQSRFMVGACVRFTNGVVDPRGFRKFKIKTITQQDDYAALFEIVGRRYTQGDWPDLIVIDGGVGQLNAVKNLCKVPVCALAKREERLYSSGIPTEGVRLDMHSGVGKLLIALRDYTHHVAITYHTQRRRTDLVVH